MTRRRLVTLAFVLGCIALQPGFHLAVRSPLSATAQTPSSTLLDLPAMVLTTMDLGITAPPSGITRASAFTDHLWDVRRLGPTRDEYDKLAQSFVDAGFIRTYLSNTRVTSDPSEFRPMPDQEITSVITQWADEAGADQGLDLLLNPTEELLPDPPAIGSESFWTRTEGTDALYDDIAFVQIGLVFRISNLTGRVYYIDYTREPDLTVVAGLGEREAARMTAVLENGSADLSLLPARIDSEANGVGEPSEGYSMLNGQINRLLSETGEEYQQRIAGYDGATNVYDLSQTVWDSASQTYTFIYKNELLDFGDPGAAHDYLSSLPGLEGAEPFVTNVEQLPLDNPLGAESMVIVVSNKMYGVKHQGEVVVVRSGSVVAILEVQPLKGQPAPALVDLETLAAAQAACLTAGACTGPVSPPDSLFGSADSRGRFPTGNGS